MEPAGTTFSVTLNNGLKCPVLGLGTWQALDDPEAVEEAVRHAIDIGYRHFDCAFIYKNEKEVGKAIRDKIAQGIVKREDLFITTKLWNTFHREDQVVPACKVSLQNFGLEYLDFYLMHWPMSYKYDGKDFYNVVDEEGKSLADDTDFLETWLGMEECVRLGLTKSIGLSIFNSVQIDRVLSIAKIKPVINQVECHPNLNQKKLKEFCKERGIFITAHSPLGSPKRPWLKPGDPRVTIEHPVIVKIAKKYNKSPAQVVLRFLVDSGIIVIPKSSSKNRIAENIQIFDFKLESGEMDKIDKLNSGTRICPSDHRRDHQDYPFNIEF